MIFVRLKISKIRQPAQREPDVGISLKELDHRIRIHLRARSGDTVNLGELVGLIKESFRHDLPALAHGAEEDRHRGVFMAKSVDRFWPVQLHLSCFAL